jgi:shikimate dehydrogenase
LTSCVCRFGLRFAGAPEITGDRIIDALRQLLRPAGRDGVVVGLLGRGIQSSRTPAMHEREGARLGLRYTYVLVDFDRLGLPDEALKSVVEAAGRLGFAGLNVTHPFKQAVLACLDRLDPETEIIGAVNTVVLKDGRRDGRNTDCRGFVDSFRENMSGSALERVVQFGAGGAGAAVGYALMLLGAADLTIVDSEPGRAERLAARLAPRFGNRARATGSSAAALADADGIVNTTPVGMLKYPGTPFHPGLLLPRQWVGDIVYFPEETELLRAARALGCRTLSGAGMAVHQAVRAFELFTGRAANAAAMAAHFEAAA